MSTDNHNSNDATTAMNAYEMMNIGDGEGGNEYTSDQVSVPLETSSQKLKAIKYT